MKINGGPGIYQLGSRHLRSTKPPSSSLQHTTLMLLIFMTLCHWAASERNESLMVFGTSRPWNKTLYKIERGCLDFRARIAPENFHYWPEDDPRFDYCCAWPEGPTNWTYGLYGTYLGYVTYYDLGLIDRCFPYWKCFNLYHNLYQIVNFQIRCERTDVQGLYSRRFWKGTVLKHGLLQSVLPFILSLEFLVILFALCPSCRLLCRRQRHVGSRHILKLASKAWFAAMHKTVVMSWVHLCLLAVIGNGFIEAVGRQNPYTSQSKAFYNYARLYVVLSALVWVSSFLQQVSHWVAEIEDQTSHAAGFQAASTDLPKSHMARHPSVLIELKEGIGMNADWKWQPIAAQVGILFCLGGFLTYIDDNNAMAAGLVFGVVVSAAAPWSGLFAVKIILNTLPFLLRRICYSLLCCTRSPGLPRRHRHTHPEHPEVPLAGRGLARSDTP